MVGIVRIAALALTVAEMWAVARLASKLFGKGIAVFATLGMFVPCFSLFVLFLVNGAATKRLQTAGMHVGLLGVDLEKLP